MARSPLHCVNHHRVRHAAQPRLAHTFVRQTGGVQRHKRLRAAAQRALVRVQEAGGRQLVVVLLAARVMCRDAEGVCACA
jgi:hypothetical protein